MNYELIWIIALQDCSLCSLISVFSGKGEIYPIPESTQLRTGMHTYKFAITWIYESKQIRFEITFSQCGRLPANNANNATTEVCFLYL